MQRDDIGEAEGLTGNRQSEVREMRNGRGEDKGFITRDHRGQREGAPDQSAVPSMERGRSTMATVRSRTEQFLIAKKSGPLSYDVPPFDLGRFEQTLKAGGIADCRHVRTLARYGRGTLDALSAGGTDTETIIVAEMPDVIAMQLRQHPGLIVEPDYLLSYAQPALAQDIPLSRDLEVVIPYGTGFTTSITVMGEGGTPLEGVVVYLYGRWWPAQGITDARGHVQLTLFGESGSAVRALYVKPRADYWSRWITQPALDPTQEHTVFLTPLSHTFSHAPHQQLLGWGQKAMKVDQLPAHYRGRGVKVAVIDSGIATSHQALRQQVKAGYDTLAHNDQTWSQDILAHGTHTAGIIAGNLDNALGIRGIAPDAEVYAYKIFPEGRLSNLIDALNLCIEEHIDVVNLSLSSDQRSELIEQKIQDAKRLGVACIVAAGSAGGPVQYPASSPHVLAVAAIGKEGEFPPESYPSTRVLVGDGSVISRDGFFSARFSSFGPEIDVCAPGVAILSSVPPNNYAVWDGTSMAAPHVTGLAALILAHHADFQGPYTTRNAPRVERLFYILKQSAQPLHLGDPNRVGAGLPDALKALNVAPQTTTAMPSSMDALVRQLVEVLQTGPLPVGARSAVGASVGATLAELKTVMRQAGLLVGNGTGAGLQGAPSSVTPGAAALRPSPAPAASGAGGTNGVRAALQECKTTLHQVGLL